jgi:hypothetical protein
MYDTTVDELQKNDVPVPGWRQGGPHERGIRSIHPQRHRGRLHGRKPPHGVPQRQRLLRREAGHQGREPGHRPPRGGGHDRPLRLRQVHLPALPQPHERHHRRSAGSPARSASTARTSTTKARRGARCGRGWAWCSKSPTPSPNPSTKTSPTARASTAWPPARRSWTRSSKQLPAPRRPVGRGEGPSSTPRHRHLRRPAAAPLHRPRHRRLPR